MKINLDNVVSIKVFGKNEDPYIQYLPEKKFLGRITRVAGFYNWVYEERINEEDLDLSEKGIMGKTIFIKPRCVFFMTDKSRVVKHFDTIKDANVYRDTITKDRDWIAV